MRLASFLLLSAAVWTSLVSASVGDRAKDYVACVDVCSTSRCEPLPLDLRLTGWTCKSNCQYTCMHAITDKRISRGMNVLQYFGKWPFWRVLGMQEPASVAFSLLNMWAHITGYRKVQRHVRKDHPMRSYYLTWALVSVNAWVWSSVFHTRDLPITEKLDYFSAALAIGYALYWTVIRSFHMYPTTRVRLSQGVIQNLDDKRLPRKVWTIVCCIAYVGHVTYLTLLPRFDYTYNMAFNLALGLAHNFLWLSYSFPSSLSPFPRFQNRAITYRPRYAGRAGLFVLLTTAATALELFDFAPWLRVIDAHALWHLVTSPIALYWYDFLILDAGDEAWRELRI